MDSLCDDGHRAFRTLAVHVREQFPGRQGHGQLCVAVECLQDNNERRVTVRTKRTLPRHSYPYLSSSTRRSRAAIDGRAALLSVADCGPVVPNRVAALNSSDARMYFHTGTKLG